MKKLFLPLLALLSACAANPATGSRTFTLVTASEERRMGESAADYMLKTYGLYRPESATSKYVTDLCTRTYAVTESAAEPIQCNFIDDGSFNASATPGYMLINRGLLPFVNSEAELAAVLGHESGHLTARHINQSATQAKVAGAAMLVLAGVVAAKSDSSAATNLAIGAGGIGAAIGLSAYSRSHEKEADALGRRYMEKLGYDPRESVHMVQAMNSYDTYQQQLAATYGSNAPQSLLDRLQSSHPATPDRIQAALTATGMPEEGLAASEKAGRRRFMEAIEGLTYGPARRWGIARKSELVLIQQRIAVPLPAGTTSVYSPSGKHDDLGTWLIAHPQSRVYVTVTSVKLTSGRSPAAVVKAMLPYLHDPVQGMEVGTGDEKKTAYTATYRFLGNDKRYRILAVAAPHPVDQLLVLTAVYPSEQVMQQEDGNLFAILKNMTFLTETAADKYKQLEIDTFTAAGETVAFRAERLPVGAWQEPLFRALNNLPQGTEMQPGQTYKTIVDPNN